MTSEHRSIRFTSTLIAGVALFGMVFAVTDLRPALSQTVQLVRVDVSVVGNGYRASKLIGSTVYNDNNEKIGTLDDIVVSKDKVMYGVLQVGGFLGIGGKLVAVPYESLQIDDSGKKLELPGASKDQLIKLAEFKYPVRS